MILSASLVLLASTQADAAPAREIEVRSAFESTLSGLNRFIGDADYPAEALRNREQGLVRFHIVIGADGRVSGCTVTGTSGHPVLDAATCALARDRFRFVPGQDEYGLPTTDQGDYVMTWRLPG
jgi:protein TonB